jgi:hypothetical protein
MDGNFVHSRLFYSSRIYYHRGIHKATLWHAVARREYLSFHRLERTGPMCPIIFRMVFPVSALQIYTQESSEPQATNSELGEKDASCNPPSSFFAPLRRVCSSKWYASKTSTSPVVQHNIIFPSGLKRRLTGSNDRNSSLSAKSFVAKGFCHQ